MLAYGEVSLGFLYLVMFFVFHGITKTYAATKILLNCYTHWLVVIHTRLAKMVTQAFTSATSLLVRVGVAFVGGSGASGGG